MVIKIVVESDSEIGKNSFFIGKDWIIPLLVCKLARPAATPFEKIMYTTIPVSK